MENPVYNAPASTFFNKVSQAFFNNEGFELFDVKPQMPKKQISHLAKKIIQTQQLVAIQINEGDGIITEVVGYPTFSENSAHLILQTIDKKVSYLISGSTIRHIRRI